MNKKVIITGATGMVGKGVLLECLDHEAISEVLVIGRNPVGMEHPKFREMIHQDFLDFSSVIHQLKGYDACFFCMGISAAGLKEEEYRRITYDYTLSLAKVLLDQNPQMTFTYVSGQGTDSTEKGRMMWARVKGKTENDLLNLGFKDAYMFRPGAIIPLRGIKSRTKAYQFMYDYFMWLVKLIKFLSPNSVVNTTQIGLAMINVMLEGYEKKVLGPKDIITLSGK
ncbi:MAG TPA: NAD-dependent epimerase/dehydratase family protein [Bacteroidales bacterium]|nr:NAD-dependent epimerase/dehydratase family protein [Bacteroidales bacterium]HRX98437.1 NAD-dependent epimerase/dehydratase family protein [Bacteroidales bacterium]